MNDTFKAKLAQADAGQRPEQSAARVRIGETFDEITAAKARGVIWQTVADLLNEEGLRATDGSPLTAAQVSAAYSVEKAARGLRKRRRPTKPAAQPQVQAQPQPAPPTAAPAALPKPATPPAPAAPRKYPYDFGGPLRYK